MNARSYLTTEPIEFLRMQDTAEPDLRERGLLQVIAKFAGDRLGADACSIYLVDSTGKVARHMAGTGYQEKWKPENTYDVVPPDEVKAEPSDQEKLGLTSWIMSSGLPFLANGPQELENHKHHLGRYDDDACGDRKLKIQTFLGVPIFGSRREVLGLIKAEREVREDEIVPPFSSEDEATLSTIAVATGRCLDYLLELTLDGKPNEAVTAWILDVFSTASTSEPDLQSFADVAAEVVAAAACAESSSIFLFDDERPDENEQSSSRYSYLTQVGGHGYQSKGNRIRSYAVCNDDDVKKTYGISQHPGITVYIALESKPVYFRSNEDLKEGYLKGWYAGKHDRDDFPPDPERRQAYCTAFYGVPLRVGADTVGVLKVENSSKCERANAPDPFPEAVQRQVTALAQELALTLTRLRKQSRQRSSAIERASAIIREVLDRSVSLNQLVQTAVKGISQALDAQACAVFLVEHGDEQDRLVQHEWGAHGYLRPEPGKELRSYPFLDLDQVTECAGRGEKVGLTAWVAATGKKVVARTNDELRMHPHHLGQYDTDNYSGQGKEGCHSIIAVPLRAGGEVIGVIKIENKKGRSCFDKEEELMLELLAGGLANAIAEVQDKSLQNRQDFIRNMHTGRGPRMWALGLKSGETGLQQFVLAIPPLPDDAVMVRTLSLGVCGTDKPAIRGDIPALSYDLVGFHEAVGQVVWVGNNVDTTRINVGDIVIPVVRRCQTWDSPRLGSSATFDFRPCKEHKRCLYYRRPDTCPYGEYNRASGSNTIGYRSRGTWRCHGFGSEYWIDTEEWLVRAMESKDLNSGCVEFIKRLALAEPLAVVWKMKREIDRVRPVRPLRDRMLITGLGAIGYLAAVVMCSMNPGLRAVVVGTRQDDAVWVRRLKDMFPIEYLRLKTGQQWHPKLDGGQDARFDIVIEASGRTDKVIGNAIQALAQGGMLVLLSVADQYGQAGALENQQAAALTGADYANLVRKNGLIVGSVNEARIDFENAMGFLGGFSPTVLGGFSGNVLGSLHSELAPIWSGLVDDMIIDPLQVGVGDDIKRRLNDRNSRPKVVLRVADPNISV